MKRAIEKYWPLFGVLIIAACTAYNGYLHYERRPHPSEPNAKITEKVPCAVGAECKLKSYWVICDDGYVFVGHGSVSDSSPKRLCEENGHKHEYDGPIDITSTTGDDWKVVVTKSKPKVQARVGGAE